MFLADMCRNDHPIGGFSKPPWAGDGAMLTWWTSSRWSWTPAESAGVDRGPGVALGMSGDLCSPLCHRLRLASEGVVHSTGVLSPESRDFASCPVLGFSPVIWERWHGVTVFDPGNTVGASSVSLGHSHCMWLGWTGGTRQSCHDVDAAGVGWKDQWQMVEVTWPSPQVPRVLCPLPQGLCTCRPVCLGCFSSVTLQISHKACFSLKTFSHSCTNIYLVWVKYLFNSFMRTLEG